MDATSHEFARRWPVKTCVLPLLLVISSHGLDRRFTVEDDVRLTQIDVVTFSPDNRYFVVVSQHGRIEIDRPESCLRVYRSEDARRSLSQTKIPGPVWNLCRSAHAEGPNIQDVRWLRDSRGLVFLGKTSAGNEQLFLADVSTRNLESLTPAAQDVTGFDVRSHERFVYTALSPEIGQSLEKKGASAAIVGTGKPLSSLMPARANRVPDIWDYDLSELWVSNHGKRFQVMDRSTGRPVPIHLEGERALALSPDGRQAVTAMSVRVIPKEWESLYPSPVPDSPYRIRAKEQHPNAWAGQRDVSQYVLINLANGRVEPLIDAPIGNAAGWWSLSRGAWSSDGRFVALSNTFLPTTGSESAARPEPCIAATDIRSRQTACVAYASDLKAADGGTPLVSNVSFDSKDSRIVKVSYETKNGWAGAASFVKTTDGAWVECSYPESSAPAVFSVSVNQGLNQAPALVVSNLKTSKSYALWNPNAWLRTLQLGNVSVYRWRDRTGREWIGGLYLPPEHAPGQRYPLVIQTHGFDEHKFAASGPFPTAFAAQELASAGIVVLQVRDCAVRSTPEEARCQLAGYESAIEKLSSDGLVDPTRVGIVGFSRTCFYVLAALTQSTISLKAASITDGVDEGYLQYMLDVDEADNAVAHEADAIIGASPFGSGLQQWVERSPVFNMQRATAPLQVIATPEALLQMWEPYAALRYLGKPVDLLILNSDEHVLSKPSERVASQGGTVDWYRFWLQDYRDPNPAKTEQYQRWESMRKQLESAGNITAPLVSN